MPKYNVDVRVTGTLDDEGIEVESVEEIKKAPLSKIWSFFWELDMKIKLFILAVIGVIVYGLHCAYVAGDIRMFGECLKPIYSRVLDVISKMIKGE